MLATERQQVGIKNQKEKKDSGINNKEEREENEQRKKGRKEEREIDWPSCCDEDVDRLSRRLLQLLITQLRDLKELRLLRQTAGAQSH